MSVKKITSREIYGRIRRGEPLTILDVRTPSEFARVHALGARLMPLDELDPVHLRTSAAGPIYVICESGGRASKACRMLSEAGFSTAYCIEGGTRAWEAA